MPLLIRRATTAASAALIRPLPLVSLLSLAGVPSAWVTSEVAGLSVWGLSEATVLSAGELSGALFWPHPESARLATLRISTSDFLIILLSFRESGYGSDTFRVLETFKVLETFRVPETSRVFRDL